MNDSESMSVSVAVRLEDGSVSRLSLMPEFVEAIDLFRGDMSRKQFAGIAAKWGEQQGYSNRANGVRAYLVRRLIDDRQAVRSQALSSARDFVNRVFDALEERL